MTPAWIEPDDARRRAILGSNRRWRAIFAALALVLPTLLYGLFARQEARLSALADHGETTLATVTAHASQGGARYVYYVYEVDGAQHEWNVSERDAPYDVGASFGITYLPEDPSLSRPLVPYSRADLTAERSPAIDLGMPLGLFVFLALSSLACHLGVRRVERGESLAPRRVSPDVVGTALGALIIGAVLAAQLDPDVRAVQVTLLGARPGGVPAVLVATAIQLLLFAPVLWMFPHLMRITMSANARGEDAVTRAGIVSAVIRAPAEQRRSRVIVLGGAAYFLALFAGWIALTSYLGI